MTQQEMSPQTFFFPVVLASDLQLLYQRTLYGLYLDVYVLCIRVMDLSFSNIL